MPRRIRVLLRRRQVSALAELLDSAAPRTCDTVWSALPLEGPVFHAKRANNEIYILIPPFAPTGPGLENGTIVPASGDLVYFYFPPERVISYLTGLRGVIPEDVLADAAARGLIDLAVFYAGNNLLFDYLGATPGAVFAQIKQGLAEMAEACQDVWYAGAKGETLRFERAE